MRARIVRIGNSMRVRIPKLMIEQAGMGGEVKLWVEGRSIVICPVDHARSGWSEAFTQMAALGDARRIDEPVATQFDGAES